MFTHVVFSLFFLLLSAFKAEKTKYRKRRVDRLILELDRLEEKYSELYRWYILRKEEITELKKKNEKLLEEKGELKQRLDNYQCSSCEDLKNFIETYIHSP